MPMILMMRMRSPTMIKPITNLFLFLIPLTITYAIVSDFGKPQHHYHSPGFIGVSHQGLPQPHAN
jgi:hypothetical protein